MVLVLCYSYLSALLALGPLVFKWTIWPLLDLTGCPVTKMWPKDVFWLLIVNLLFTQHPLWVMNRDLLSVRVILDHLFALSHISMELSVALFNFVLSQIHPLQKSIEMWPTGSVFIDRFGKKFIHPNANNFHQMNHFSSSQFSIYSHSNHSLTASVTLAQKWFLWFLLCLCPSKNCANKMPFRTKRIKRRSKFQ